MSFTSSDYAQLQKLMHENPEHEVLIQKLLDSHQYTISKISHELRNPLVLIYSTFQLIESQHPEVRTFKYWKEMGQDMEFMNQLLIELSSYNNCERLHMEPFSSRDFLQTLCLSFAASCVESEIEFTSYIAPDLPYILADKIKLREAILNILKNAKEAISMQGQIRMEAEQKDGWLTLRISDNGCGIPPEYLETLFDAFVTHKSSGTGLGLSIVKRTMDAHKGTISVSSDLGQGTTFLLQLPVLSDVQ